MFIIYNIPGLIMGAIGIALAFGITYSLGWTGNGGVMTIAGLIWGAQDLWYRLDTGEGHMFRPDAGGQVFFIPMWLIGVVVLLAGIVNALMGR